MIKRFLKCITSNTSIFLIFIHVCFQSITTISTYNISEETEFDIEPIEKTDLSPYIYPILAILNLSGISDVDVANKTDSIVYSGLMKLENSTTEWKNRTEILSERLDELIKKSMEESKKYEERNIKLAKEINNSLEKISPKSENSNDDQQSKGNFLMKLLFNFYITPILTFYKPLLTEEVKFYKNLINISKQLSNKTENLSNPRQETVMSENDDDANEGLKEEVMSRLEYSEQITVKNNNSESEELNKSLEGPEATLRINAENDSVLEIIPRLKEILRISLKGKPELQTVSYLEENSTKSLEYDLKKKKLVELEDLKIDSKNNSQSQTLLKPTEMPQLSFTNNSEILTLFKPGEIPRIETKNQSNKKPKEFLKIELPLAVNDNDNNTEEKNFTQNRQDQGYIFDTILEIPDDSDSLTQKTDNPIMRKFNFESSTILPNVSTNLNESDVVEPKILYSPEGSMILGVVKPTKMKSFRLPTQSHHKSRMQPVFSSRYLKNSTGNGSINLSPNTEHQTKNMSFTEKSLLNRLFGNTSIYDNQQKVNKTKTVFFANKLSKNVMTSSTTASTSVEVTESPLSKIKDEIENTKNIKNVQKRELPISDQYNLNDRQELASYFYNGKKIHESYFNYAKSIDSEIPQDAFQQQDEFNRKSDSSGNEAIIQKNQDSGFEATQYLNPQNFRPDFNIQQNIPVNFDYINPSLNPGNDNRRDTSTEINMRSKAESEKETSTLLPSKNKSILRNRKNKKSQTSNSKKIINRKNVNSKRKNNRVSKLKRKNSKTNKGKVYSKSQIGRKKVSKTYSEYKNSRIRNNFQQRSKNNKLIKNRNKISKKVRNKKKISQRRNDDNNNNNNNNNSSYNYNDNGNRFRD